MPRKKIDALVEYAKGFGAKGLAYLAIHEDGTYKCSFSKFMKPEELDALVAAMGGKPGDLLLFAADKDKVVFDVLGNLRLEIARQLDLLKKDDFKFLWVTEFPLLEYSEEEDRYVAMHHPFTMPMEEDLPLIDTDPGKVRAKAYDIVLNGTEMGGGSVRIHQADIQEKMFEVLGFTKEKAQEQFGFLLDAFKYGVPPHAGLAYGMDRMVMLMLGRDSIRDVIAFPKVQNAGEVMSGCPDVVDPKQLEDLHILCELPAAPKALKTSEGTFYARTVILATGANPRELGLAGEEALVGRGVAYCAACDGMRYKGKTVAVVGGGNSAAGDALLLSRIAERVVLVHRRDQLRATKIYHEPLIQAENVEFRWNSTVTELLHEEKLTGIRLRDVQTGAESVLPCDGLFISVGRKPATELVKGQLELDAGGYVTADETTRTNLPGVYAVGDVRTKPLRQVVTAVADGAMAVHMAEEYLAGGA